jgi:RNA polymerase sigma factor (sigma-70 family)
MAPVIPCHRGPGLEPESLEECLARIGPRLKKILKGYNIPSQDAEDVLQEALLGALLRWDTIRNIESWLIGTLRFQCARYWRRQRSERVQALAPALLEALCEPQAPVQEQTEFLLDLRRLSRGLGKRHQSVLWLRFGLGLSVNETAQRLGYRPASIRKLTSRGIGRIRRWAGE